MNSPVHSELAERKAIKNPILRIVVLIFGWINVVLGIIGIFLPVMPTTPFLLLAAACFLRTSPQFYDWLVSHPKYSRFILYYLDGKGIPLKAKIYTLVTMWFTVLMSAFVLLNSAIVQVILPIIGLLVTLYILRQPTLMLQDKE